MHTQLNLKTSINIDIFIIINIQILSVLFLISYSLKL
jgi:hypothetical protein